MIPLGRHRHRSAPQPSPAVLEAALEREAMDSDWGAIESFFMWAVMILAAFFCDHGRALGVYGFQLGVFDFAAFSGTTQTVHAHRLDRLMAYASSFVGMWMYFVSVFQLWPDAGPSVDLNIISGLVTVLFYLLVGTWLLADVNGYVPPQTWRAAIPIAGLGLVIWQDFEAKPAIAAAYAFGRCYAYFYHGAPEEPAARVIAWLLAAGYVTWSAVANAGATPHLLLAILWGFQGALFAFDVWSDAPVRGPA
jgi:hypothetical protein